MSAQPRVIRPRALSDPTWLESYGNMTSQTLRLAAGLFDAMRSVTRGVPEMCTVSVNVGRAYKSRCSDCAALALAWPLNATSSTRLSMPGAGVDDRVEMPLPPSIG